MQEILSVNGLVLKHALNGDHPALVNDVHLQLRPYRSLCLIGESGCGKTLVGQAIMGTIPEGLTVQGSIMYKGINLLRSRSRKRRLWGRELFLFPQEPGRYLNPLVRALPQVAEVYRCIHDTTRRVAQKRGRQVMRRVDLRSEDESKYPWQLSGGMGQRLLAAISLAQPAQVIIADEPTKGLDREMKYQTVSLLKALCDSGKSLLVITHDLEVARMLNGRLAVMYGGRILEVGPAEDVLRSPRHPYTKALWEALPQNGLKPIPRQLNQYSPGAECVFIQRCPKADNNCSMHCPPLRMIGKSNHLAACYSPCI